MPSREKKGLTRSREEREGKEKEKTTRYFTAVRVGKSFALFLAPES
ncbi:hypothetical protein BRCON_2666 [Candidatus Sumerlaea chitinivorans]|uniref:Uncharacterized protein n=1 Tax=Sumerlaea chitinivorans TaxID=2250252 RepID=A0A2Z4Y9A9_SUMC1|nr:hypothetical protein BRCON_2666 [Candidatus Sumerlaea chitinivorans]